MPDSVVDRIADCLGHTERRPQSTFILSLSIWGRTAAFYQFVSQVIPAPNLRIKAPEGPKITKNVCVTSKHTDMQSQKAWQSPAWWWPFAVLQTPNFCRNMDKCSNDTISTPKTPVWYRMWVIIDMSPIHSELLPVVLKKPNFCCHWQQESVGNKLWWHH